MAITEIFSAKHLWYRIVFVCHVEFANYQIYK